jgi:hypothetical protein
MHPDIDSRISLDRSAETPKLAHDGFISARGYKAEISGLAAWDAI